MNWVETKKWLPLTALLPVMWLGAYIVFWLDRADCVGPVSACLGNAFGNWAGDLIMLKWVKGYQTLFGGFLAFGAGAFVWLSYRSQRADTLADRAEVQRAERLRLLGTIRHQFLQISAHHFGRNDEALATELLSLQSNALQVSGFSSELAAWIGQVGNEIERTSPLKMKGVPEQVFGRQNARANADLAAAFLDDGARLIGADARYRFFPAKKAAAQPWNPQVYPLMAMMFSILDPR